MKTPAPDQFESLNLPPEQLKNLSDLGYQTMTDIQRLALPSILEGKDVIGQSKTGSGKTAAFGLGVLNSINPRFHGVQTLILCPTRELADQVANDLRTLARVIPNVKILTLCGGTPLAPQRASLEYGAHIVVGTPGRIEDHLSRSNLDLSQAETFVLDEADRMLDMGFQPAIEAIINHLPKSRQTLLFSATFPDSIETMSRRIMNNPLTVKVESSHAQTSIEQLFYKVDDRMGALRDLLLHFRPTSSVIFCNTKKETQEICDELNRFGFSCIALHGDLDQKNREKALVQFSNKSVSIMVATDVAARGLDIDALDAVINYQLAHDPEVHVHRVGRTGRASNKGKAISLFTDKEQYKVERLYDALSLKSQEKALPTPKSQTVFKPEFSTVQIDGGKKQKLRAGDILGALTRSDQINGSDIGKINIFDFTSFVGVKRKVVNQALEIINQGKMKGRTFKAKVVHSK